MHSTTPVWSPEAVPGKALQRAGGGAGSHLDRAARVRPSRPAAQQRAGRPGLAFAGLRSSHRLTPFGPSVSSPKAFPPQFSGQPGSAGSPRGPRNAPLRNPRPGVRRTGIVADDDRVVVRWMARSARRGSFMGIPPTKKPGQREWYRPFPGGCRPAPRRSWPRRGKANCCGELPSGRWFATGISAALRAGLNAAEAADILWAMTSPALYRMFVQKRRWSRRRYARWLHRSLSEQLFDQSGGDG